MFEGTVIEAPNGTGRIDMFADRPMKDWVTDLAAAAQIVVAIGDCACWGGIPAMEPNPSGSTGLQFHKREQGRLPRARTSARRWACRSSTSPAARRTRTGSPRSSWRWRPAAPATSTLDELHRPETFFKTFTQTGCTRVQFFEYKQSTMSFGEGTRTGCLFYEFGCRGPMTHSPCNRILWNRQSSKTRAGMPCLGCTEPEFPHFDLAPGTVFKTQKVSGIIPKEVPEGTDHLTYMAHAAAARIAAPQWSKEDMFVV